MSDDLRAALPRSISLRTYVLLMFSYPAQRWFVVLRSDRRKELLDGLALNLPAIAQQPCCVIEVPCDPDDIEAIERAALKQPDPRENAELSAHFDHFLTKPRGLGKPVQ